MDTQILQVLMAAFISLVLVVGAVILVSMALATLVVGAWVLATWVSKQLAPIVLSYLADIKPA